MNKLYENIKNRRLLLGLTQTELAEKTGYADKSMIAKIEKGIVDIPQSKVKDFALALLTTSSVLLEDASVLETLLDGQDGMDAARVMLEQSRADKAPMSKKEHDKWDKLFSSQEKVAPDDEKRLVGLYRQLNTDGQEKLLETADDMVQSGKYISTATGGQKRDGEKMA